MLRQFSFLKTLCFRLFPKFINLFVIHIFQQTLNVLMEFFSIIFLHLCLFRSAGSIRTVFSEMSLFSAAKEQPFLHAFGMSFGHHSINIHHVRVLFGKGEVSGIVVGFLLFLLLFSFLFFLPPTVRGFLFVLGGSSPWFVAFYGIGGQIFVPIRNVLLFRWEGIEGLRVVLGVS